MILADHALALRHERAAMAIERAFARALSARHPSQDIEVLAIADGAAVFTGAGSPMSQATGLGLEGAVTADHATTLEHLYHRRNTTARVVVCPMADPSLTTTLGARGFVLAEFEQVMVRSLDEVPPIDEASPIAILPCEENLEAYVDAVGPSFTHNGVVSPEMRSMMMAIGQIPNATVMLATIHGQVAGGASLLIHEGVAMLAGAATKPEFRRRGVQEALFRARLNHAKKIGCELAVMGAEPGSGSQRNAQRKGFQLAYTKVVLAKEPPAS